MYIYKNNTDTRIRQILTIPCGFRGGKCNTLLVESRKIMNKLAFWTLPWTEDLIFDRGSWKKLKSYSKLVRNYIRQKNGITKGMKKGKHEVYVGGGALSNLFWVEVSEGIRETMEVY